MINIIIATTALNRPELHNDNIKDWFNLLNTLDKEKYNLIWFINIDIIDKLNSSYNDTKTNFENIINNIPLKFYECEDGKGNFLKACKRLSSNIEIYVESNNIKDNTKIIWLEDDWKLNYNINLDDLISYYSTKNSVIMLNFFRNNYIHALAPSISDYNIWSKLHLKAWKNQIDHIDPEHCVGLYYLNNFDNIKKNYINLLNVRL